MSDNINEYLLLELNKMEKVQLSGENNGIPISKQGLVKLRDFSKNQSKDEKPRLVFFKKNNVPKLSSDVVKKAISSGSSNGVNLSPTSIAKLKSINSSDSDVNQSNLKNVRNISKRVMDRDGEQIKLHGDIVDHQIRANKISKLLDDPKATIPINAAANVVANTILPGSGYILNAVGGASPILAGFSSHLNNHYYKSGKYDNDVNALKEIRKSQQANPSKYGFVDDKVKKTFAKAPNIALDDIGKRIKFGYSEIPKKLTPVDFKTNSLGKDIANSLSKLIPVSKNKGVSSPNESNSSPSKITSFVKKSGKWIDRWATNVANINSQIDQHTANCIASGKSGCSKLANYLKRQSGESKNQWISRVAIVIGLKAI